MGIIKHIEDIKSVVGVYSDVKFEQLKVFIEEAEQEHIINLLGKTFYDALAAKKIYEDKEKDLVNEIAKPVVTLAFLAAIPQLNVGISAQGLVVTKTDDVAPASEVRTTKLERSLLDLGHKRLDSLIKYLEENEEEDAFDALELPIQAELTSYFLKNAEEFNDAVFIDKNRYVFLKMIPLMRENEQNIVQSVLGTTFYTTVIDSFKSASGLDAGYKPMLLYVRKLLAYQTLADSIEDFGLRIDSRGITIFNNNYAETVNVRKPPEDHQLKAFKEKHQSKAAEWLTKLIDFLNSKSEDALYTNFKESSYYNDEEEEEGDGYASPIIGDGFSGF